MSTSVEMAKEAKEKILKYFIREFDAYVDAPDEVKEALDSLVAIITSYYEHYSETWLEEPHENLEECPTYYDGCNCTVGTLEHVLTLLKEKDKEIEQLKQLLGR